MTPDQIVAIPDPRRRAVEAQGFITRARQAVTDIEQVRDAAILELLADGWTVRKVAATIGLSPTRVQQAKPRT